jgi:putative nucleotidyltransferase with HDIG domain
MSNPAHAARESATELIERLMADVEKLPSQRAALLRVVQAASDPQVSARDLGAVCAVDPALVSRLLRMVNSVYYARPAPVTSITTAVSVLGFETVSALALASALADPDAGVPLPESFWHSAATVAVTTRHAARLLQADESAALSAGLLCDVGQALLFRAAPDEYAKIADSAESGALAAAERALYGVSHGDISARALRLMGLPEPMYDAVARHHRPVPEPPRAPLEAALRAGVLLAQAVDEGSVRDSTVQAVSSLTGGRINGAAARGIALDAAGEVAALLIGLH